MLYTVNVASVNSFVLNSNKKRGNDNAKAQYTLSYRGFLSVVV